jgi:hypothetical protein
MIRVVVMLARVQPLISSVLANVEEISGPKPQPGIGSHEDVDLVPRQFDAAHVQRDESLHRIEDEPIAEVVVGKERVNGHADHLLGHRWCLLAAVSPVASSTRGENASQKERRHFRQDCPEPSLGGISPGRSAFLISNVTSVAGVVDGAARRLYVVIQIAGVLIEGDCNRRTELHSLDAVDAPEIDGVR